MDFLLPVRVGSLHGCKSWWLIHPHDLIIPAQCEYHNHFLINELQKNAVMYDI